MDHPDQDLQFNAPSLEELQPLFPSYEIGGFIAQGGMGAVYFARQISLDRPVAIKILPRKFGADPQFRASFEAEAKSMARLNHPNLIGVYDFGDVDGMLYIIMELVEGKSLHYSSHGKRIDQIEAARLVAGICHGLAHAHQAGILHRDIKPGNILLGPGAQPKIGDFGLARPVGQEHNPEEIVWGTPGYSAPEVVNHPDTVDHRADIFAVGVLLYELLTAQVPSQPWQPPSRVAGCNPAFDAIIRRATHPSPNMRYENAEEIARELDGLVKKLERGVVHRTTIPTSSTAKVPSLQAGARPLAPAVSSSKSKSGTGTTLLVLGGLAFLAIGAVVVSSLNDKSPSTQPEDPPPVADQPAPKPRPEPVVVDPPGPKSTSPEDRPPATDPKASPEPPEPKPVESPTQVLARLKKQLQSGDLSELPPTAAKRGQSHYYLVDTPLDWQGASHFAEDHGAQLAVLDSAEALSWALEKFMLKAPVWIGLSDSGMESKWNWVSGDPAEKSLWAAGQPDDNPSPDDGEDFAVLLPDGTLADFPASRQTPFLIQWSEPPGNRGSLANQLLRTGQSFKDKRAPIFPAGTRNIGGSRFLLVPRSTTWEEASTIAQAAGGHLAVPSSQPEADWIRISLQKTLGGGDGCWIGGQLAGIDSKQWTFVTGERFQFVNWAPGRPDHSGDHLNRLQLWRDVDGTFGYKDSAGEAKEANYFLVEWSVPSRRNMPSQAELKLLASTAEDWLTTQRQKTADQEKVAFERWERRHQKNVKDFVDDIESETKTARNFSREARDFVEEFVEAVEKADRIPNELARGPAQRFIGNMHEKALAKQTKIWDEYEQAFLLAQERYLAELKNEIDRRVSTGDRKGALYLQGEVEAAAEKDYFREILGGELPVPPPPENELDDQEDR